MSGCTDASGRSAVSVEDVYEIIDRMRPDDTGGLDEVAEIFEHFPHGQDSHIERHWITHAIDVGSLAAVRWVIGKGVDLRFRDDEGYTVLHSCLERERSHRHEIFAALIEAGADVNAEGVHFWTPLHMAAIKDDRKAMKMLMDAGADPTRRTPIDNYATPAEEARRLGHAASADFIERYAAGRYPYND